MDELLLPAVIVSGAGVIVIVRVAVPVPPTEFVAEIVTKYVPTPTVGVPEMTPVTGLTVSPAGSAVAL